MIGFTAGGGATYGGRAKPFFMPIVGDWTVPPAYTAVYYDKAREQASPGYYAVELDNGTKTELTATRWTGMMRFTFPPTDRASVIVNLPRAGGTVEMVGDRTIRARRRTGETQNRRMAPFLWRYSPVRSVTWGLSARHPATGLSGASATRMLPPTAAWSPGLCRSLCEFLDAAGRDDPGQDRARP